MVNNHMFFSPRYYARLHPISRNLTAPLPICLSMIKVGSITKINFINVYTLKKC